MSNASENPGSPDDAIKKHIYEAEASLGESLAKKHAVYLDTKYWILLRNADKHPGRQATSSTELLRLLRKGVADGTLFVPVSEAVVLELLKQDDLSSRLATAALIDELSRGVTLMQEERRIATEIAYFVLSVLKRPPRFALQNMIWHRLGYALGLMYPRARSTETDVAIQKTFFDLMWTITLKDLILISPPLEPDPQEWENQEDAARLLNEENCTHANDLKSFEKTYGIEVNGLADLYGSIGIDTIENIARMDGITPEYSATDRRLKDINIFKSLLHFALKKDRAQARRTLRTIHIYASLWASMRWDRKRKVRGNDLDDFGHATAALGYCSAFFTERSLRSMVTARHIKLDELYQCHVVADVDDAVDYTSQLMAESR